MRKSARLASTMIVAILALAACATPGSNGQGSGGSADKLQVMTYPTEAYTALIETGIKQGFFKDAGVEVTRVDAPPRLEAFQGLRATKSDITIPTTATFASAIAAGETGMKMFCGAQPYLVISLMAPADSDLPVASDKVTGNDVLKALAGKTVGTLTPAGSGFQKLFEAAMNGAGVKNVTYVNLGPAAPSIQAALGAKQVDAALSAPSATQALKLSGKAKELMVFADANIPAYKDLYGAAWAASGTDLAANPKKYQAFCQGVKRAEDFITQSDEQTATNTMQSTLNIDPALAGQLVKDKVINRYDTNLPAVKILHTFDTYVQIGLLAKPIDNASSYVYTFN